MYSDKGLTLIYLTLCSEIVGKLGAILIRSLLRTSSFYRYLQTSSAKLKAKALWTRVSGG